MTKSDAEMQDMGAKDPAQSQAADFAAEGSDAVSEPPSEGRSVPTGSSEGGSAVRPGGAPRSDKVTRMGTASIPGLIAEFAIPSIAGMLVNGAYNVIDSIFLGQAVGEQGLSTATVAMPIMTVFMALSMLVGNGGNALAALRMGEGRRDEANRSLGNTVTLSLILSVIVAVAISIPSVLDALLTVSGATVDDWEYARSFIRIISLGFIFQCIGMGVNNFIRTAGAPNRALVTMVVGAVVCTALNYLFVMVLGWGVRGSALATVGGQAVSCACVLWYFLATKGAPMRLQLRFMGLRAATVRLIFSLGLASCLIQAGMAVVNFVLNNLLNQYGALNPIGAEGALASIGVVQRVSSFVVLPLIGMAIAIQPLLGFNYGAHLFARVRKTFWGGVVGATGIAVVLWAVVQLFAGPIVGFFGIDEGPLRSFTVFALGVQLAVLPLVGFQIVGSNYFQATGQPAKSIFLSLTRQILFLVPLLCLMPLVLPSMNPALTSLDALYFATPIADFLSVFTTVVFMARELRRLRLLEEGKVEAKF